MPRLSLIMSTYNDGPYLAEAIESLLTQTYRDYEFIIIDDAAQDNTPHILARYAQDDPRLKIIRNERNLGLTLSLNRGLELAGGEFIGRMDADDIATPPTRLADQVAFLEAQPEIGMLSGDMVYIAPGGELLREGRPIYGAAAGHAELCWRLLWGNPISHITVMLRREVLEQHRLRYRPEFNRAEDYELWATLSRHTRLYRSQAVWAKRRILDTSVSHSRAAEQAALSQQLMGRELALLLGKTIAPEALGTLFDLIHQPRQNQFEFIQAARVMGQAYAKIRGGGLPPSELRPIEDNFLHLLLRLSRRGRGHGHMSALYPLWQIARYTPRPLLSRLGLQYLWGALQNRA
jgi:hypothetical protein